MLLDLGLKPSPKGGGLTPDWSKVWQSSTTMSDYTQILIEAVAQSYVGITLPKARIILPQMPLAGPTTTYLARELSHALLMSFSSEQYTAVKQNTQSEFVNPLELSDASAYLPDVPDAEAMKLLCSSVTSLVPQFEDIEEDEAWY